MQTQNSNQIPQNWLIDNLHRVIVHTVVIYLIGWWILCRYGAYFDICAYQMGGLTVSSGICCFWLYSMLMIVLIGAFEENLPTYWRLQYGFYLLYVVTMEMCIDLDLFGGAA